MQARTDLRIAAADYLEKASKGESDGLDTFAKLERHSVFLAAALNVDANDTLHGQDLSKLAESYENETARILLTGSPEEIDLAMRQPITVGVLGLGPLIGLGSGGKSNVATEKNKLPKIEEKPIGAWKTPLPKPRTADNLKGGPLENASKVSGNFKLESGPSNGTVYRADSQGNITSYATYDKNGRILTRVDVTGAAHNGIPTPHVLEYGRNKLPDGSIRVHTPRKDPRPATSQEIP